MTTAAAAVDEELTECVCVSVCASAIESDAQYAVEKLNGHEFQGRRMRLGASLSHTLCCYCLWRKDSRPDAVDRACD